MNSLKEIPHYRNRLGQELKERIQRNKNYSLRAFSRDLQISPGFLSHILSGEKDLSEARATKLFPYLEWDQHDEDQFLLQIKIDRSTNELEKKQLAEIYRTNHSLVDETRSMSLKSFEVISEWYYSAILSILEIDSFSSNYQWMAKKLGIHEDLIKQAISQLNEMGLIEYSQPKAKWQCTQKDLIVSSEKCSEAIRCYHRQNLDRAIAAIDSQPSSERFLQGATFSVSKDDLLKIQQDLEAFRKQMMSKYSLSGQNSKYAVYQLEIAFFRQDQK